MIFSALVSLFSAAHILRYRLANNDGKIPRLRLISITQMHWKVDSTCSCSVIKMAKIAFLCCIGTDRYGYTYLLKAVKIYDIRYSDKSRYNYLPSGEHTPVAKCWGVGKKGQTKNDWLWPLYAGQKPMKM